ncbi:hypothetical protein [Streptomyces sp. NPDC055055]
MAQTLDQIAAGMTPRMTEAVTFWGDRNPQGSTARMNLGKGGGTLGAIHRRDLIGEGRDERGNGGYYLTPLGWALYTHLTGQPRPADTGRLTLEEALAEAYAADVEETPAAPSPTEAPAAPRYLADYVTVLDGEQRVQRITVTEEGQTTPVQVEELPYGPERNAARSLEALGWEITGMETYGGPSLFTAWVQRTRNATAAAVPEARRADTEISGAQQVAEDVARRVHPTACDFEPVTATGTDTVTGWTYRGSIASQSRYGWVTTDGRMSPATYLFRGWAEEGVQAAIQGLVRAPGDVDRPDGVTVVPYKEGRWAVERDSLLLGFINDQGAQAPQGRYSTWSPYAQGAAFQDPAEAVDAIVCQWPQSPASIARETGAPAPQIAAAAELLETEWSPEGRSAYVTEARGEDARLTREAAAAIREELGLPAARFALAIGDDARTWARFHSYTAAIRQAASYGLDVDTVRDTAPLLTPDQARGIVTQVHPRAGDFRPVEGEHGTPQGYTFSAGSTRFGFITMQQSFSMALEPTREDAAAMLPAAVLSDVRQAQRPSPAVQRAAALSAQQERAAIARAEHRAATDDRSAAEAHRHGAALPAATVDRLVQRTAEQPGPFKAGDRIVCADGRTRTALGMAPEFAGEPARVIVEGGAQWLAAECEPARDVETAPARPVLVGTIVQHDGATDGCVPADVEHPDVQAARRALAGLAAARLTDHHDVSEPTEEQRDVRGYMVNPRGQGRVAIYWLEGGETIRRDTPLHGAALNCLEDRMKREGWATERMGRSALCLFAHVPDAQRQG